MTIKPLIERAYEVAKSGSCATVAEVEQTLRREGYTTYGGLSGRDLRQSLSALCRGIDRPVKPERKTRRQSRPRMFAD